MKLEKNGWNFEFPIVNKFLTELIKIIFFKKLLEENSFHEGCYIQTL